MFCSNCGRDLPVNSLFCPDCGTRVPQEEPVAPAPAAAPIPTEEDLLYVPAPVEQPPVYEAPIAPEPVQPARKNSHAKENVVKEKRKKEKKTRNPKKSSVKWIVLTIVFVILTVGLAALNVLQYLEGVRMGEDIETMENTVSDRDQTIKNLNRTISDLEDQTEELEEAAEENAYKVDIYDRIVAAESSSFGFANTKFNTSEGIVFLRKGGAAKWLTLNAKYGYGVRVSVGYPSDACATVSFSESDWSNSTEIKLTPVDTGVVVMTFTNSASSDSFQILVVVTE